MGRAIVFRWCWKHSHDYHSSFSLLSPFVIHSCISLDTLTLQCKALRFIWSSNFVSRTDQIWIPSLLFWNDSRVYMTRNLLCVWQLLHMVYCVQFAIIIQNAYTSTRVLCLVRHCFHWPTLLPFNVCSYTCDSHKDMKTIVSYWSLY